MTSGMTSGTSAALLPRPMLVARPRRAPEATMSTTSARTAGAAPTARVPAAPAGPDLAVTPARPARPVGPVGPVAAAPTGRARGLLRPVGHYVEMVVAMVLGMVVLAPVSQAAWGLVGVDLDLPRWAVVAGLVMALDMTVGMAAWMLVRRHGRAHVVRMCAAMLLPVPVVAVLELAGTLGHEAAMVASHAGMLVAMAVVVARHPHR